MTSPPATAPSESIDAASYARLDALYQRQLRQAAAEVAAAIAHAAGTPLNVISGRSELIRQDPTNAAPQLARIDDQVRKLAEGLRQFVDYLTARDASPSGDVPATQILTELSALLRPLAARQGVELSFDTAELGAASIDQQVLGNLVALVSWAITSVANGAGNPLDHLERRRLELRAAAAPAGALFELQIPGLAPPGAWRLENFDVNASGAGGAAQGTTGASDTYRVMAICAAVARGQGGKLLADPLPDGKGLRVRLTYRSA